MRKASLTDLNNLIEHAHRNFKRWVRPMFPMVVSIEILYMAGKDHYQQLQSNEILSAEPFYLFIT